MLKAAIFPYLKDNIKITVIELEKAFGLNAL